MMNYTFTFTAEQLKLIDTAISDLPYRVAAPLVAEMNKQIVEQERKDNNPPAGSE